MEVYIADILLKSLIVEDYTKNLRQTFDFLKKYQMRLNSTRCTFGVSASKFFISGNSK